jgi:hypothetical protein
MVIPPFRVTKLLAGTYTHTHTHTYIHTHIHTYIHRGRERESNFDEILLKYVDIIFSDLVVPVMESAIFCNLINFIEPISFCRAQIFFLI